VKTGRLCYQGDERLCYFWFSGVLLEGSFSFLVCGMIPQNYLHLLPVGRSRACPLHFLHCAFEGMRVATLNLIVVVYHSDSHVVSRSKDSS
jgi:hypothetical protein